jgi:uncharacterized protein YdaU (DUF1376 family)
MHYYQHHIGDFIKDTSFLTNEEIGIYLKLIWIYYDTEKPLPNEINLLCYKTGARDSQLAVQNILKMYFQLIENEWHHTRCDKEIAEYAEFCAKQKANGLKGGRPKATQIEPNGNPMGYQAKPKKTLTTNHKPLTTNQINTPDGVNESLFKDFLEVRKGKKAKWTETALKGLQREAVKANMTLEQVMQMCCERGWAGFKAEWVETAKASLAKELPLGTDQQIEHAYKVECNGDPSKANFRSYQEMRKFIQDFRDKSKRALQ